MILFKTKSGRHMLPVLIFTIGIVVTLFILMFYRENGHTVIADANGEIGFNRESGFYEKPFFLEMDSILGDIYYTFDGSLPDDSSNLYKNHVLISDNSAQKNVYSNIKDISAGFYSGLLEEKGQKVPQAVLPDYPVDKCVTVRARVCYGTIAGEKIYGGEKIATYFIGYGKKAGYDGIMKVNIITDPDNLFSYDKGIYVTGKTFAGSRLNGSYAWWEANYRNRGPEWERKVTAQFFDEDGTLLLSQKCGMRIHGAYSRIFPQKGLTLNARFEYDGNKKFLYPFFGGDRFYRSLVLASGGNDIHSKSKDYVIGGLLRDTRLITTRMKPVEVFLEGEYWGMYYLSEKYDDESFYYNNYGINEENVIVMKDNTLDTGLESDYKIYGEMRNYCLRTDLSNPEYYKKACEYIDIDSYIDYNAVMIYLGRNGDWPSANIGLMRARQVQRDNEWADGKWKWILFDLNSKGMEDGVSQNSVYEYALEDDMFVSFMKNGEFRERLAERLTELSENELSADKVKAELDYYRQTYKDALMKSEQRYYGRYSMDEINAVIDGMIRFFEKRPDKLAGTYNW